MRTLQKNDVSFPKTAWLGKKGVLYSAFADWRRLLHSMRARQTHVNKLVRQPIANVGYMDASSIGAGGVWMSTTAAYPNTV